MDSAQKERYTKLEKLAQELLDNMGNSTIYHDTVEDVDLEVDESGYCLTLQGDFVRDMLRYLACTDETNPRYGKFTIMLDDFSRGKLTTDLTA